MAKRSAILLVRWKSHRCVPKVARGAGRCSLGALHAVCAAARVIHQPGGHPCGCSNSADVFDQSARRSFTNYALMLRSCNGRANIPGLLRARHVDRGDRWIPKKEQMRVSASFVLDRDRRARLATRVQWRVCGVGSKVSFPAGNVLHGRYPTAPFLTPAIPEASKRGCSAGCPSRPGSPSAPQTQYKCGKSRYRNNHPLGKPDTIGGYCSHRLIAFVGVKRLPKPALSNGAQMLVHSGRWIHEDPGQPRDGAAAGSVPNRGVEGSDRCGGGIAMPAASSDLRKELTGAERWTRARCPIWGGDGPVPVQCRPPR